ncbi:MAG: hypothetical protein WBY94_07675 [Polyangiaceae bacterium]
MHVALRAEDKEVLGQLTFFPIDGPLRGQELRREVRGADCESVATSLTLVAAVILDPEVPGNGVEADVAPSSPPGASHANPAPGQTWPSSTREEHVPSAGTPGAVRFWFGVGLEGALGLGPDLAVVPRAFADLELAEARLSVRLSFGRGYTRTIETAAGSAEITLTDLRLEPCVDVSSPAALRIRACGIVDAGMLEGVGTNTKGPRSESRPVTELGLGLRPTWIIRDSISIGLLAGAAAPLARYRFYFASPDTTAYRVPTWAGLLEFSMGVHF